MLPVILGGIALAAASYKIKEYCDREECEITDILHANPFGNEPMSAFETYAEALYDKRKEILYEECLDLSTHIGHIKERPESIVLKMAPILTFNSGYIGIEPTGALKKVFERYAVNLERIRLLLKHYDMHVQQVQSKNRVYTHYGKPQKKILKKAYKMLNVAYKFIEITPMQLYNGLDKKSRKKVFSEMEGLLEKHESFLKALS